MLETKHLHENNRNVRLKATEKLHVHYVLAAILGDALELWNNCVFFY